MSISASHIGNVLRTYHEVLRWNREIPKPEESDSGFPEDRLSISEAAWKRYQTLRNASASRDGGRDSHPSPDKEVT